MNLMALIISVVISNYPLIPTVPGSYCTPSDPDFSHYRYPERIAYCFRNVATWRKDDICERDGVYNRSNFTVDHLIPLSHGGSNHDDNLWCQHKSINVTSLENRMYRKLARGEITREEAVKIILNAKFKVDIRQEYDRY